MKYVVKMYDLRGFMFAHKTFKKEAEARDYASCFKRNRAVVERVAQ
jgi:hypothetical protein